MNLFKSVILLLLIVLSSTVFAEVNVNFRDMEMTEFVSFVSEFTGKNFVYDKKDLKGQVSIESSSEINSDDIMEIFASTLRANGLDLVNRGSYTEIIRQSDMNSIADSSGSGDSNALITTVLHARNYDTKMLTTALGRLKSKAGFAEVLKGLNAIVIRDSIGRITKIKKLMEKLEMKASGYTIRMVKIEHASANNVQNMLAKLYNDMQKKLLVANEPVIVADDYSNILVVACEDRDFEKISYIIAQLDSPSPGSHNAPKVFYLNNANAEDVEKVLNKLTGSVNANASKKAGNVKSSVAFDKATNSIIVFGDPDLYAKVEKLIEKLDKPREQVYVEALILETTMSNSNSFGVEWGVGGNNNSTVGSAGYLNSSGNLGTYAAGVANGSVLGALPGGFGLGIIGNSISYNGVSFPTLGAFINFSKTITDINLLSNPQILTLDNEEAEVFVGENRPFLTSTKYDSNDNLIQSYDYRDVGVRLKITPQISANDTVTLQIDQEVKKVTSSTIASTAPTTLTRNTKTKVKLKDGTMMVISGLLKDDSDNSRKGVPGLSRIPLIGWLFKSQNLSFEKTNMMVFIIVHIIRTQAQADEITKKKRKETVDFKSEINKRIKKEF